MCDPSILMIGSMAMGAMQSLQQNAAARGRAQAQQRANEQTARLAFQQLKLKQADSLEQEMQEIKKSAKKQFDIQRKGRAERASIQAARPLQFGRTSEVLLEDSQRRQGEATFSVTDGLRDLRGRFVTGRQIDRLNISSQLAGLPIPNFPGSPALGIAGGLLIGAQDLKFGEPGVKTDGSSLIRDLRAGKVRG